MKIKSKKDLAYSVFMLGMGATAAGFGWMDAKSDLANPLEKKREIMQIERKFNRDSISLADLAEADSSAAFEAFINEKLGYSKKIKEDISRANAEYDGLRALGSDLDYLAASFREITRPRLVPGIVTLYLGLSLCLGSTGYMFHLRKVED